MSILYKCVLSVFIISILFATNVYAEKNVDLVKRKCPSEYSKYSDTVEEYIRMKEYVENCGCEVVPLYACFADNNMDFIDLLEADQDLMKSASKIVSSFPEFFAEIKFDPLIVESIMIMDQDSFQVLKKILKNISQKDIEELKSNSNYFSYYLLTCMLIEGNNNDDPKKIDSILRKLKRKIPKEKIDLFTFIYVLKNIAEGSSVSPSECYNLVDLTLKTLGKKTTEEIIKADKVAFLNFIAPSSNLLEDSQSIDEYRLQKLKKNYVEIMRDVYNLFGSKEREGWGIKISGMISKYIPDALIKYDNPEEIKQYFQYLFESQIFALAVRNGFCDETTDEALEKMFTMFSPPKGKSYSPGNLGLIAKWFQSGQLKEYMNKISDEDFDSYIRTMYFLPKNYNTFNCAIQKDVFEDLLFNLSSSQVVNGMFLCFLSENTTYFDWIAENDNISVFIKSDHSQSHEKYQYILLTQYPAREDDSLFARFTMKKKVPTEAVSLLSRMGTTELQEHNFTTSEKNMAMVSKVIDNADTIITIASIAAIPFTAGASTSLVAAMAIRKGSIATAKRAVKTLAKRGIKSAIKLSGKKGRKKAVRELSEVIGFSAKRGRKNIFEQNFKKGIYRADSIVTSANLFRITSSMAAMYFLASRVESQKDPCDGSISIEKKRNFELWMDQLRKK